MDKVNIAWNLLVELRKEIVEGQKIRAQVIGFKITFVSAAIGLIGTNIDKVPKIFLVIPAFAAIFFDFLINSYSFSIKRIGFYVREHIEPLLKNVCDLPEEFPLWEEFQKSLEAKNSLSFIGYFGITLLAIGSAVLGLFLPFRPILSSILFIILIVFLSLDLWAFRSPYRFRNELGKTKESDDEHKV